MALTAADMLRSEINKMEQALAILEGTGHTVPRHIAHEPVQRTGPGGRRTMSPEAKERIAAAQKRRWAKPAEGAAPQPSLDLAVATPAPPEPAKVEEPKPTEEHHEAGTMEVKPGDKRLKKH